MTVNLFDNEVSMFNSVIFSASIYYNAFTRVFNLNSLETYYLRTIKLNFRHNAKPNNDQMVFEAAIVNYGIFTFIFCVLKA